MRKVDDYEVFQRAHNLTLEVYAVTKRFPREEAYGLAAQMRRAAYSIPMNLKEGSTGTETEFFRYVRIGIGSKEELSYQVRLAHDLGYLDDPTAVRLSGEIGQIGRMLYRLLSKRGQRA